MSDALVPLSADERARFDWLGAADLQKVTRAVTAAGGEARFVGGCVRDSLAELAPKDFDIAVDLEPDATIAALKAAGLRFAPTGVEHGTVTAIVDHRGVELTSLRRDVSTDGRRATVAYTKDWAEDAARRDFTINALYLTTDGRLFDPTGGRADLAARRVRFIGEAAARIREDYLRILRFFRFSARFSDSLDTEGLKACAALKGGLSSLSAERIGAELIAVLAGPRAPFVLSAMEGAGVLAEIWPEPADIYALARLIDIAPRAPAMVRLAALYGEAGSGLGARLRLSNAERAERRRALAARAAASPAPSEQDIRELIYQFGETGAVAGARLACAHGEMSPEDAARIERLAQSWPRPDFPLSGRDALDRGVAPGPAVSALLSEVEAAWIADGFPPRERALALLDRALAARTGPLN